MDSLSSAGSPAPHTHASPDPFSSYASASSHLSSSGSSSTITNPTRTDSGPQLTIVTYNVHDGFQGPYSLTNSFPDVLDFLSDSTVNADVVCFQEVTWSLIRQDQFEAGLSDIGFHYVAYGKAMGLLQNGFYGQVIASKLPFEAWKTGETALVLDLPRGPPNEGRSAMFVRVRLAAVDVPGVDGSGILSDRSGCLVIGNCHLDVWDRSGKTRLSQIKAIHELMRGENLFPAVLAGDFNTVRRRDYTATEWSDLCQTHQIETESLGYLTGVGAEDAFDRLGLRVPQTHLFAPKRRVDFLFLFDSRKEIEVKQAKLHRIGHSDHFPLSTRLSCRFLDRPSSIPVSARVPIQPP